MTTHYAQRDAAVIGRYLVGDRSEFLPMSERELQRAQLAAGRILDSYGFARGRYAMFITTLSDIAQMLPMQRAMAERNLIPCYADASPYEFGRIKSMMQRFDIAFVMGVNGAVLDGLAMIKLAPEELFKDRVVWARPDAHARLQGLAGIELRRMLDVGPALALECRLGSGAHLDPLEWHVEREGGELLISSRLDRARHFQRTATGIRAELTTDICGCGHAGPRVRMSAA